MLGALAGGRSVVVCAAGVGGILWLRRLGRRSGVERADLDRALPGDDLVPGAAIVVDRATVLDAPRRDVWPWLVQLGKGRGGWYMPSWLEALIVHRPETNSATRIVPELQRLELGDAVPDYGPGEPVFRVMEIEPPKALVYLTIRQRSRNWTWPTPDEPLPDDALALSWALVLDDLGGTRSRLHVRVRARRGRPLRMLWLLGPAVGLVDYATIVVMFAGLEERLRIGT